MCPFFGLCADLQFESPCISIQQFQSIDKSASLITRPRFWSNSTNFRKKMYIIVKVFIVILMSTLFMVTGIASHGEWHKSCRCVASDSCWPTAEEWDAFIRTIGGLLINCSQTHKWVINPCIDWIPYHHASPSLCTYLWGWHDCDPNLHRRITERWEMRDDPMQLAGWCEWETFHSLCIQWLIIFKSETGRRS